MWELFSGATNFSLHRYESMVSHGPLILWVGLTVGADNDADNGDADSQWPRGSTLMTTMTHSRVSCSRTVSAAALRGATDAPPVT